MNESVIMSTFAGSFTTTGFPSLMTTPNDVDYKIGACMTSSTATPTTTTAQTISDFTTEAPVQTCQAVSYIETYNEEEISELVAQIDSILDEQNTNQDVYVRTLRK